MKLLRWFALLLCLCVNAENVAVWRESGENVTLRCSTAECSSSSKGYDGMYLYHTGRTGKKQVLYYHAVAGSPEKITLEDEFKNRFQKEGSLEDHTITISELTVDDSGLFRCVFLNFKSNSVECSLHTLFVSGVTQCSRSTGVPCTSLPDENGPPLVLIIISACTIGMLVIIIVTLLIVPRMRRRISSSRRRRAAPNDTVYEIMTKNSPHPPPVGAPFDLHD